MLLTVFLVCTSCAMQKENPGYIGEFQDGGVWVCYNPESEMHGLPCEVKHDNIRGDYESCYWIEDETQPGTHRHVLSSFCWLLKQEDCEKPQKLQWQEENCKLMNN